MHFICAQVPASVEDQLLLEELAIVCDLWADNVSYVEICDRHLPRGHTPQSIRNIFRKYIEPQLKVARERRTTRAGTGSDEEESETDGDSDWNPEDSGLEWGGGNDAAGDPGSGPSTRRGSVLPEQPQQPPVKRGRGRPRKYPRPDEPRAAPAEPELLGAQLQQPSSIAGRGRGRGRPPKRPRPDDYYVVPPWEDAFNRARQSAASAPEHVVNLLSRASPRGYQES